MLNSAKALVICYEELRNDARNLLEEAVNTGNLTKAWEVFSTLEDILPKLEWIPSRDRTPLIRAYIEEKGDNWERYSYQSFTDMLDEEAHMIGEGCSEEEFFQYTGMTKVSIENLMWEILHNGYVGFTNDW